ncbi:MAG: DUF21 domain-containing protein [Deltaproteobacteria bacterium]|nr:DUF21 domain-containing protein [Deltaproteobacteria bacterium]
MILLFLFLFMALFISFLCSIMEAVLLSIPQSFLISQKEQGKSWAERLLVLKENINRPLSAILSLNTIANTIGAAGVGAQSIKIFGEVYFGIISATMTILILIFSEIIPKSIGARFWRELAMVSSQVIRCMVIMTYPLVYMSLFITKAFSGSSPERTTSREEISALAGIGVEEGIVHEREHKIIQNILKLKNVKVTNIMTPRVVLVTADENLSLEEFLMQKDYLKFSRIPIYSGLTENISGYVFREQVFEKLAEGSHDLRLKDIKREIVIIPDTRNLFGVWETLLQKKEQLSLIVDEYGGIEGIVTMEDIIETLLGLEIIDEKDVFSDMQKFARDRWKARQTKYKLLEQ